LFVRRSPIIADIKIRIKNANLAECSSADIYLIENHKTTDETRHTIKRSVALISSTKKLPKNQCGSINPLSERNIPERTNVRERKLIKSANFIGSALYFFIIRINGIESRTRKKAREKNSGAENTASIRG